MKLLLAQVVWKSLRYRWFNPVLLYNDENIEETHSCLVSYSNELSFEYLPKVANNRLLSTYSENSSLYHSNSENSPRFCTNTCCLAEKWMF